MLAERSRARITWATGPASGSSSDGPSGVNSTSSAIFGSAVLGTDANSSLGRMSTARPLSAASERSAPLAGEAPSSNSSAATRSGTPVESSPQSGQGERTPLFGELQVG